MNTTLAAGEELERAPTGSTPSAVESVVGEPGIVPEQLAAERAAAAAAAAGQVAAADEADRLAGEQERAAVDAVVEHRLGARADLGIARGMSRAAASAIPSASSATGWPKTGPIPSTSIPRAKQAA